MLYHVISCHYVVMSSCHHHLSLWLSCSAWSYHLPIVQVGCNAIIFCWHWWKAGELNSILFAIISSFIILIMTMIQWVFKYIYTTKNRLTRSQYFLSFLIENISLERLLTYLGQKKDISRSLKKLLLYNLD